MNNNIILSNDENSFAKNSDGWALDSEMLYHEW